MTRMKTLNGIEAGLNQPQQPNDDWLREKEHSETFVKFMDSLKTREVKRASGSGYSERKFERNYSTSRR